MDTHLDEIKEVSPEMKRHIDSRIQAVYGTTLATRILAVVGLIFILTLMSVAVIRVAHSFFV